MQSVSRCIPAYWFLTTPGKHTLVQLNSVRYVEIFELYQTLVMLSEISRYLWLISGWLCCRKHSHRRHHSNTGSLEKDEVLVHSFVCQINVVC